ncbi:uncharacterized protein LOC143196968 isoform X2 [Rhynchophorus ferrugineus]|uniref:uncharacterized protein LOC143196968 isoform X2 n=1 Tax=Rhynchophorus ferrugineus TaxID=354439 RepID=UPI003FCD02C1
MRFILEGENYTLMLVFARKYTSYAYHLIKWINICWIQISILHFSSLLRLLLDLYLIYIKMVNLFSKNIASNQLLNLPYNSITSQYKSIEFYNEAVNKELKTIYYQHLLFLRAVQTACHSNAIRIYGGLTLILGLAFIPFSLFVLKHFTKILRMCTFLSTLVPYGIFFIEFFNVGQLAENQQIKLNRVLQQLVWYEWNIENRKTYMMLLSRSQNIDSITIGFNQKVNRISLLKIPVISTEEY